MRPLLSVVIPTRGRDEAASKVVRFVSRLLGDNGEVVVQDCTPSPTLGEHIHDVANARYEHTGPVSMSQNWERAIARAQGDFVTVIGNDDAVMPCILDAARWMERTGTDAVTQRIGGFLRYYWPDYPQQELRAVARVFKASGEVSWLSPGDELRNAARSSGADISRLPWLYYGIVRRSVVERMRAATGCYVDTASINPDHYSAFALASFVRKFAIVDYAIFLPGICGERYVPNYKERAKTHWAEYSSVELPVYLPRSSVPIIEATMAESMVRAFVRTGRSDLIGELSLPHVYAKALLGSPRDIPKLVTQYLRETGRRERSRSKAVMSLGASVAQSAIALAKHRVALRARPFVQIDRSIAREVHDVADLEMLVAVHEEYVRDERIPSPFTDDVGFRVAEAGSPRSVTLID